MRNKTKNTRRVCLLAHLVEYALFQYIGVLANTPYGKEE